jgi:hypothetical protein
MQPLEQVHSFYILADDVSRTLFEKGMVFLTNETTNKEGKLVCHLVVLMKFLLLYQY